MSSAWTLTNFHDLLGDMKDASMYHLLLEGLLVSCLLWIFFRKSYNPQEVNKLSKEEEDALISQWNPEPLVPDTSPDHFSLKPHIVNGKAEHYIDVDNQRCLNLATHNYLSFVGKSDIEERAIQSVYKYGVGSCGPRGFYGTVDIHLELEEKLARFMGLEEAILYAYGFSTIASAIPAYAKRGDVIFVDEQVNFAIQKGLDASRSKVFYFKHNDSQDLEQLMKKQDEEDKKKPKKAKVTRRFLVIEGIYMNTGNLCCLPPLMDLARRYKCRVILDEGISFGTLGKFGRGITEHFNINREDVDLIVGNMECSLGSIGGFCVGSSFIVEHQRLSGLGYCFSASLPPLLAAAAIASLEKLEEDSELLVKLRDRCFALHSVLERLSSAGLSITGYEFGPVKHLLLSDPPSDFKQHNRILHQISDYCISHGVAVIPSAYLHKMECQPRSPSLRITVNVDLSDEEIQNAFKVLHEAAEILVEKKIS